MKSALDVAKYYFDLSNKGSLDEIEALMTERTTYSSQNTGVFLGGGQIIEMQRKFFAAYKNLHWDVKEVSEVRPGVIKFDFVLTGVSGDGTPLERAGVEYVIVFEGKLQHVEVRNA